MKTITISQAALPVLDASTDTALNDPSGQPIKVSWPEFVRVLFQDTRVIQALGTLDSFDLRKRLLDADFKKGVGTVQVNDTEFQILSEIAKKPTTINAISVYSLVPFLRAICDAR